MNVPSLPPLWTAPPILAPLRAPGRLTTSLPPLARSRDAPIRPVVPRDGLRSSLAVFPASSGSFQHLKEVVKPLSVVEQAQPPLKRTFETMEQIEQERTEQQDSKKRLRAPTQRRREQCRNNQARYRMRQNQRIQVMEESASRLREEIALLAARREGEHMPSHVVLEFFRRFRNGVSGASLQLPVFSPAADGAALVTVPTAAFKSECNATYVKQVAFLRTVVTPDADIGDGLFGPDALLEQWWRYSCFFKRMHLALDQVTPLPSSDEERRVERVLTVGRITVKVHSASFEKVFPYMAPNSELGYALTGQLLSLPLRAVFEFSLQEGSFSRISRLQLDVDVAAELLRALGSVPALSIALHGAQISPCGYIGSLQGHPVGDSSQL